MSLQITESDPAAYLTDEETISAYLTEALRNEDARGVQDALADVDSGVRRRRAVCGGNIPIRACGLPCDERRGLPDSDAMLKVMRALRAANR